MEKIGCPKYGGAIALPVAAEYFKKDECKKCPHFELCREEKEIAGGMDKC